MKLTAREREIIRQLLEREIDALADDEEDSKESRQYADDLEFLEELFIDCNRIEAFI